MKIRKIGLMIIFILSLVDVNADSIVTSTELIEDTNKYNGQEVTYVGEIVGDIMNKGQFSWIHVNDGNNSMSFYVSNELIKDIKYVGRYNVIGDQLEVSGIFIKACIEHSGDIDIHVNNLKITHIGYKVESNESKSLLLAASVSSLAAITLLAIVIKKHR